MPNNYSNCKLKDRYNFKLMFKMTKKLDINPKLKWKGVEQWVRTRPCLVVEAAILARSACCAWWRTRLCLLAACARGGGRQWRAKEAEFRGGGQGCAAVVEGGAVASVVA